MAFDPSKLKQHSRKGSFGIKTEKSEVDTSASVVLREQQELLVTALNNTLKKSTGQLLLPHVSPVKGKQVLLYQNALRSKGINAELDPSIVYFIDRTGFCPDLFLDSVKEGIPSVSADYLGNEFIYISSEQSKASIINPRYSFLERLLIEVNNKFTQTLSSFSRSEAVIGEINNIIIEQGVERFLREGTYRELKSVEVAVSVETPAGAVTKLAELLKVIKEIENIPETITDLKKMKYYYGISENLKNIHKKLNDLVVPENDCFKYNVNCFRYGDRELELFYFKTDKPVFIFFTSDSSDSQPDYFDDEFIILNGNNRSGLLNNLLEIKIVDYLLENIESQRDSYAPKRTGLLSGLKAVTGGADSSLPQEWHDLNDVASVLRLSDPAEVAKRIGNGTDVPDNNGNLEKTRRSYIKSLNADLKSRIVFPRSDAEDRLICDLISKCSSSSYINLYGNSPDFISDFYSRSENEKIEALKEIDKNMRFNNQNNLLVNYWLNKNYPGICEKAGIKFSK